MGKFNVVAARVAAFSPVTSTTFARNHEGATGFARDPKSELFLLAVSNFVGEDTFYENAVSRDQRYVALIRQVAVEDLEWMEGFLRWLRGEANLRSVSLVGAAEATQALLAAKIPGGRRLISSVLQRPDEPGEMLAYWTTKYGRKLPKPVKRGIADAALRLYTEYALLKYDTASHAFRFADVLSLTHPGDQRGSSQRRLFKGFWQKCLFGHAMDRRYGRDAQVPEPLHKIRRNVDIRLQVRTNDAYEPLLSPEALAAAGMTWEDSLSLAGPNVDKAQLWTALLPVMNYMAVLRNLRNLDDAGVADAVAEQVAARLADPEEVARSRQFPFRFYAAFKAVRSLRWGHTLEKALNASLANIPALSGRTLVLVDQSPSMFPGYHFSTKQQHRDITNADLAKLFGSAVALRADNATLVSYGNTSVEVPFHKGDALLRVVNERFSMLDGTDTFGAINRHYAGHNRVVIVTDEQNQMNRRFRTIDDVLPKDVAAYVWNIGGNAIGSTASGAANRHTFAGLTDQAFRMVPLLEKGVSGTWPWLMKEENKAVTTAG